MVVEITGKVTGLKVGQVIDLPVPMAQELIKEKLAKKK